MANVDRVLAGWRQGDCVLGEQWFTLRLCLELPLSVAARAAAAEGVELAEESVLGLVVVSQTCDIVRSCSERPFVEVCPLVEVDDSKLHDIARGRRPAYALVPALHPSRLVADLDRTMTVEKPVVARWSRTPGWTSDAEARSFAQALARKRLRFAFPDDFNLLAKKLQARLTDKHEKNSEEGRALRALREIRVQAHPSWDANPATLVFWFIRHGYASSFEGRSWDSLRDDWLSLLQPSDRFAEIHGEVTTLDALTAAAYVASDPLDLDHLSSRNESK